jgi:Cdc6-like AAA superfamily ATPase|tara:strand:+ start:43 stop:516 length:474 start_codon:yes stop_codon:yes gene_type:complete
MIASINITSNSIKLENKFSKIINKFPRAAKKALARAAIFGRQQIVRKTKRGEKPSGGAFARYSEMYKKSDQFKNKKNKFVDLFYSGQMLGDISTRVIGRSTGEIFFLRNAEAQKAFGHHTGVGRLPERPFFSIGRVDRKKMVRRFEKDFRRFSGIKR